MQVTQTFRKLSLNVIVNVCVFYSNLYPYLFAFTYVAA